MAGSTSGHLLIADISGYTRYLTSSELDHAQGVLESLMGLLIDRASPPLQVSGLEGDAVFSYALGDSTMGGQTLVEILEATYVAFRRAIEEMVINTTCGCNACANISTLDLKFFVHHGSFTTNRLLGRDELVGSAVIEIHRIMKNAIAEKTGIAAYAAYTDEAIEALGLEGFASHLVCHVETYPDVGDIAMRVQDMHPVYEARKSTLRVEIPRDDVLVEVVGRVPTPAAVTWELLTQPAVRAVFMGVERQEIDVRRTGRVGVDSVFLCYHGKGKVSRQTIVDWEPFHHMVTEDTTPVPGTRILLGVTLEAAPTGTILTVVASRARGRAIPRLVCNVMGRPVLQRILEQGVERLRDLIEHGLEAGTLVVPGSAEVASEDVATSVASSLNTDL